MTPEAIYDLLVVAKGNSPALVYPIALPENPTLPAIRYMTIGGRSEPTFDTSGLQWQRLQVDVFGAFDVNGGYLSAWNLRERVLQALNGYQGTLSDGTFCNIELIERLDGFESHARHYRCAVEFYLLYTFQ